MFFLSALHQVSESGGVLRACLSVCVLLCKKQKCFCFFFAYAANVLRLNEILRFLRGRAAGHAAAADTITRTYTARVVPRPPPPRVLPSQIRPLDPRLTKQNGHARGLTRLPRRDTQPARVVVHPPRAAGVCVHAPAPPALRSRPT